MTHEQTTELEDDQLEYLAYTDTKAERQRISHEIFEEMEDDSRGTHSLFVWARRD